METRLDPDRTVDPVALVESRRIPAQLCVIRDGQVLLDLDYRCRADGLFWVFSASKPFIGLLVHELVTDGLIDIDAPVADHWPAFAGGGKGHITVRMVLQHRTGMATGGSAVGDALAMADWDRTVRRIERATPRFVGLAEPAYQYVIYGHILGELVQQVTGQELRKVMQDRLIGPLGLADTYLGLPAQLWERHVDLVPGRLPFAAVTRRVNTRRVRGAVIPAAGISTTARDLATFYAALLDGGRGVIDPRSIERMREPSSEVVRDRFIRWQVRWAQGFQLGLHGTDAPDPMGKHGGPNTFGHNGSDNSVGWADPDHRTAFAYCTAWYAPGMASTQHLSAVSDAARRL